MNLTKEYQACLIAYSRQQENLPIALAIWAIQEDLRAEIITEFLKELQEYVKDGLQRKNLPWCVAAPLNQSQWKEEKDILILSIKRERSNREIGLYKWEETQEWETYLCGKCDDESALTCEQLEPTLVDVGTTGGYAGDLEWWRRIEKNYRYLGSDEALTTMNVENDRKEFVEHYGKVLLKAVEITENLL